MGKVTLPSRGLFAFLSLLLFGPFVGPSGALPEGHPPAPYESWLENGLAQLYEEISPAVVRIESNRIRCTTRPSSSDGGGVHSFSSRRLIASGVVVEPHGCVVTTARVAQPGDSIMVHFPNGDKLKARYRGTDAETNIAVLHLDAPGPFPYLRMAAEPVNEPLSEWVAAVAYGPCHGCRQQRPSLVLAQRSMVERIRMRFHDTPGYVWSIRAPFLPGNSGGALMSLSGEWLGLIMGVVLGDPTPALGGRDDTSRANDAGLIVPARIAAQVIARIESTSHAPNGFLGVQNDGRPDDDAPGVAVSDVLPESPADRHGLQAGDRIIRFSGEAVSTPEDLTLLLAATEPGDVVALDLLRAGQPLSLSVCLGDADALALYTSAKQAVAEQRRSILHQIQWMQLQQGMLHRRLRQLNGLETQSPNPDSTSAHP